MKPASGDLFDDGGPGETPEGRGAGLPVPLAERFRPRDLAEVVGPPELFGPGSFLGRAIAADRVPSLILWGPPGSGKTTLARIIAAGTKARFLDFSAVNAIFWEIYDTSDSPPFRVLGADAAARQNVPCVRFDDTIVARRSNTQCLLSLCRYSSDKQYLTVLLYSIFLG